MFRASLKGLYGISLGQALKNSGCKSQRKLEIECGYDVKLKKKTPCKVPHPYIKPDNEGIRWCPKCGNNVTPFNEEEVDASDSNDRLTNNDKGKLESKEKEGGQGGALEYLENLSEGNGKGDER